MSGDGDDRCFAAKTADKVGLACDGTGEHDGDGGEIGGNGYMRGLGTFDLVPSHDLLDGVALGEERVVLQAEGMEPMMALQSLALVLGELLQEGARELVGRRHVRRIRDDRRYRFL